MQEKMKSEGKCLFCGKMFAKAGVNKHLAAHLSEIALKEQTGKSFLLKVETEKRYGLTHYFLSLWVDGEATLKSIDKFLRDIWLECCGHLSAFSYPRRRRRGSGLFNATDIFQMLAKVNKATDSGEIPMSRKAKDVLYKGLVLEYEYDFGSTTALNITVVDVFFVKAEKKIVLLSRNEPLPFLCVTCKKVPATQICTACMYDGDAEFCDKCAKKHAKECEDFDDYASMPIVNSPRMGVCGYEGGRIDIERDGVYQL